MPRIGLGDQIRLGGGRQGIGTGLLLDEHPGAAAAYSLRKLRSDYSGDAIRVRRSSDNNEKDIGFSGGTLDTTALLNFVGSGDGYVVTWYDQSGNGRDATQSTQAEQPQIVSSGSVLKTNGQPAVDFDGVDDVLVDSNDTLFSSDGASALLVGVPQTKGVGFGRYGNQKSDEKWAFYFSALGLAGSSGANFYSPPTRTTGSQLLTTHSVVLGSSSEVRRNGSQVEQYTPQSSLNSVTVDAVLAAVNYPGPGPAYLEGRIQEVVLWPDETKDVQTIEDVVNDHYSVY